MLKKTVTCLILLSSVAHGESDGIAQYRDYLPQQLLSLTAEERHSSVPMMFNGAANLAASPAGDLVMQLNLNMLMYDGFANYEEAKRAFQTDLGEEATGALTVWQIHTLGYRASRANAPECSVSRI